MTPKATNLASAVMTILPGSWEDTQKRKTG